MKRRNTLERAGSQLKGQTITTELSKVAREGAREMGHAGAGRFWGNARHGPRGEAIALAPRASLARELEEVAGGLARLRNARVEQLGQHRAPKAVRTRAYALGRHHKLRARTRSLMAPMLDQAAALHEIKLLACDGGARRHCLLRSRVLLLLSLSSESVQRHSSGSRRWIRSVGSAPACSSRRRTCAAAARRAGPKAAAATRAAADTHTVPCALPSRRWEEAGPRGKAQKVEPAVQDIKEAGWPTWTRRKRNEITELCCLTALACEADDFRSWATTQGSKTPQANELNLLVQTRMPRLLTHRKVTEPMKALMDSGYKYAMPKASIFSKTAASTARYQWLRLIAAVRQLEHAPARAARPAKALRRARPRVELENLRVSSSTQDEISHTYGTNTRSAPPTPPDKTAYAFGANQKVRSIRELARECVDVLSANAQSRRNHERTARSRKRLALFRRSRTKCWPTCLAASPRVRVCHDEWWP
eukprot:6176335-Pleurochrysis_carterae.AAC.1